MGGSRFNYHMEERREGRRRCDRGVVPSTIVEEREVGSMVVRYPSLL
jgi:hypothetical protein